LSFDNFAGNGPVGSDYGRAVQVVDSVGQTDGIVGVNVLVVGAKKVLA